MWPGPHLIKQCHQCQKPFEDWTLSSGNTFGATMWTDGKCEAPMLPDTSLLVKCPHCNHLLWIDEAPQLGEVAPFGSRSQWPDAQRYGTLSEEEFLSALEMKFTDSPKKVHYLRLRAWWAANDPFRKGQRSPPEHLSAHARKNMKCLYDSISESALSQFAVVHPLALEVVHPLLLEEQRVLKTELARELGLFEEAKRLLAFPFGSDWRHRLRVISDLVEQRETNVARVRGDEAEEYSPIATCTPEDDLDVPALIRLAQTTNNKGYCRAAIQHLARMGPDAKGATFLVDLLTGTDGQIPWRVFEALTVWDNWTRPVLRSVTAALKDERPKMRGRALAMLLRLGAKGLPAFAAAKAALADEDAHVRLHAARAVRSMEKWQKPMEK
jgi:hypothetical protein